MYMISVSSPVSIPPLVLRNPGGKIWLCLTQPGAGEISFWYPIARGVLFGGRHPLLDPVDNSSKVTLHVSFSVRLVVILDQSNANTTLKTKQNQLIEQCSNLALSASPHNPCVSDWYSLLAELILWSLMSRLLKTPSVDGSYVLEPFCESYLPSCSKSS